MRVASRSGGQVPADRTVARCVKRSAALEAWEPAGEPFWTFLLALLRLEQGTFEGLMEVFDRLATWVPDLPVEAPLPLVLAGVGEVERAAHTYQQLVARRPWESSDHM